MPKKSSSVTEESYIITDNGTVNGFFPRNFSIGYDKTKKVALWVAYPMHKYYNDTKNSTSSTFTFDPKFANTEQMDNDGVPSPYNRGHQVASADRYVSYEARKQIYYMTNMTPQLATFNSPVWSGLEQKVRDWTPTDTLYVVTGCYFDGSQTSVTDNGGYACPVPTHYYKVVLCSKTGTTGQSVSALAASQLKCIGFWYSHTGTNQTPANCAKSVKDIETLCGFEFFVNVPNAPKTTLTLSDWGL